MHLRVRLNYGNNQLVSRNQNCNLKIINNKGTKITLTGNIINKCENIRKIKTKCIRGKKRYELAFSDLNNMYCLYYIKAFKK